MKKKFLITLIGVCTMLFAFGTISASAETEGIYRYTVSNGEAKITDCDTSISGEITIPDTLGGCSVTGIGDYAFWECSSLESITIPNSITSIGSSAFTYCTNLTKVNIADISAWCNIDFGWYESNPLYYAKNLYLNDVLLTDLVIPADITTIKQFTFLNCENLKNITLHSKITAIGEHSFEGCSGITELTIPDSVGNIGQEAFKKCVFDEVVLGKGIKKIGSNAFSSVINLYVSDLVAYLNCDYYNDRIPIQPEKIYINGKRITNLVIPDGVTKIPAYTFSECSSLTSITIPEGVTTIGGYAFQYCENLTKVTMPDSVRELGVATFQHCKNLTDINLSSNLKEIPEYAFSACPMTSATIPEGVKTIGDYAFANNNFTELTIPNSVTSIGKGAFRYGLFTEITIPKNSTTIGDGAFEYCRNLNSVTFETGVKKVGKSMFNGCSNLKDINFPNTLKTIDEYAFQSCSSLEEINIPPSVIEIEQGVFNNCSNLSTVYYNGTEEEYSEIYIASNNTPLNNAEKKFFWYVTIIGENGEQLSKKMYDVDALLDISDIEEKFEHTIHLYTDSEYNNEYALTTPISENLTLYLRYIINQYPTKFIDYNGDVIWEGLIDYGAVITTPENPTRERTQQYTYTFAGWKNFVEGLTQTNQEMVFTAMYDATVNQYTYKFIDENGVVIKEETVDYGTTIELPEYTPKANTQQYTYTFLGWEGYTDGMILTDDVTFNAKYQTTVNQYTYKFIDENGAVIKEETVDYGTTIELPEYTPKANTQQYTYTFLGWDGYTNGMQLTDDITFNVKYEITTNQYTYKFLDEDGTVLKEETVDYGTQIIAPEISDKTEYYLFDYWQGYTEGITLTDDITFTAVYKYKEYTITAEGLADAITVTYNSNFVIQPQTPAEEYLFIGYFTEKDGAGVQITNENGESVTVYNTVGDLVVYPYFESVYMNKIVLSETTPTILGGEFTQKLTFATEHNAMYLFATLKYPEYLNFEGISGIDFVEASKDSEKTIDSYKYLDITAVYDYDGENISKNTKVVPFEIRFSVATNALVGDAKIEIDNAVLVGDGDYAFETVENNNVVILPKLAESIEIIGKDEIDATEQFSAVVSPDYTTDKSVVWSVDDETVATITQDGTVTPVKNGTVIITATAKDGSEVFATKTVSVIAYAKISSLDFGSGVVLTEFNPDIRKYTVYVKENATSISLTPTFSDGGVLRPNGSGVWVSGRSKDFDLNDTATTITLNRENVTDMTSSIYTVEVIKFEGTKTEVSEDKKSFTIKPINIENGKTVILALYNGDVFVEMQSAVYGGETIPFTTTKTYTKAKVMVWDDLINLKPIYDVEFVK